MRKILFEDKKFYKILLATALPIALQNLISSGLNMVDTMMIGKLGETEIASVGLANKYFFLFILIMFGINSGSAIFIAQFWGEKDVKNIRRVLGLSLITGGSVACIFAVGGFLVPELILRCLTDKRAVIELGSTYLRIVSLSYILTTISFAYGFACRSIGEAKLPLYVSMTALASNSCLNYVLIFGKLGFPAMGVKGAAFATLISRSIEVILILGIIYKGGGVLAAKLSELKDLSSNFIRKFFKTTTPVIANEAFWALGMVAYSAVYGRMGESEVSSVQIADTIQSLFMVISMGLANASAIMIGNKIGAKEEKTAIEYARRFSIIGPLTGIVLGIGLFLSSPLIVSFFELSDKGYYDTRRILIVMSIFMAIKIFNAILVVGILRSGGDTTFSLMLELGSVWVIGVPMAFFGAFVLKVPVYWVIALISIEEIVKAAVGIPRLVSNKWVRNVVEEL